MGVRNYAAALRALLPKGRAWNREAGSRTDQVLTALADELGRVDDRAGNLMEEIDPMTVTELLPEWERELGITPDAGATDSDRRSSIIAHLYASGGQSEDYFLMLLHNFQVSGYITNEEPFEMGVSGMGDPVGGSEWRHVWTVVTADPITEDLKESIESTFNRYKPAHTVVLFQFEYENISAAADEFHEIMNVGLPAAIGSLA